MTADATKIKKPRKPVEPKDDSSLYPPDFVGLQPPKTLWRKRTYGEKEYKLRNGKTVKGVLHLPGVGSKTAQVVFLSPCVFWEEQYSSWSSEPSMLKGGGANFLKRCLTRAGFKDEDWFYTSLCKYNVDKLKPKAADIRWNQAVLDDELTAIKPKIIVCLGKVPFDHLFKIKFKLQEIRGGFFRSEKYDCLLYPMDTVLVPIQKPEYMERFIVDIKEVKKVFDELNGVVIPKLETHYQVIENAEQLRSLMAELAGMQAEGRLNFLSIDCEWAGQTAWGGLLRSIQICWKPGYAAYIKLRDETTKYVFDVDMAEVGDILRSVFEHPGTRFIGHNVVADLVWIEEHFHIRTYGRVGFDTMTAQQLLNEYADLKLERMAVQYTDLGRYDLDLLLWKKKTKFDDDVNDGYGRVPDEIIEVYGCKDCDSVMRMVPILTKQLIRQRLIRYYFDIALPFSTDGFHELMRTGLPVDREYLDEIRETFSRNRDILLQDFRSAVRDEADVFLRQALDTVEADTAGEVFSEMVAWLQEGNASMAMERFKEFAGPDKFGKLLPFFEHWVCSDKLNIDSTNQVKRWLFDVKGLTPLKTTKKDGIQMAWEKVLTFPKEKQLEFSPSADKQTMKVFANSDPMCARVEEIKAVGNIVKSFLNEPDEDGNEQGLHKWIQPDGRLHSNFSMAETGRARSWKPNLFNLPKVVTKPIERAFERVNLRMADGLRAEIDNQGRPKEEVDALVEAQIKKPISLRAVVKAPPGWCIVGMDLKTAEIVALAHISGDENMLKVLTEPDYQFARISKEDPKKVIRIGFNSNEGVPESEWDSSLLAGQDDPRILRNDVGNIISPRRDLHWEMATSVAGLPREKLDERMFRDGVGKISNFCIAEGELVTTKRGKIPIERVLDCDLLWDGVEWVSHEGITCNGRKVVHRYQGLWATDNHQIWTEFGEKISFGKARQSKINLRRVEDPGIKDKGSWVEDISRNSGQTAESGGRLFLCPDGVRTVWREAHERVAEYGEGSVLEMPMQESAALWLRLCHCENTWCQIRGDASALRTGYSCIFRELQGSGHKGALQVSSGVHALGCGKMAEYGFQGIGFRSGRQQRALFKGQPSIGRSYHEFVEQKKHEVCKYGHCAAASEGLSAGDLHGCDVSEISAGWHECRGHCGAASYESSGRGSEKTCNVYDILNAGPRRCYTCSGVLVSNSTPYGAAEALLERMVEASVGKRPPEGTGKKMLETYKTRYPTASRFLEEMELIPSQGGTYRSISGRVRHFFFNNLESVDGLSEYARNGILSPLTRQARNFPMQELVAATTAKSLAHFIRLRNEAGLQAQCMMVLYDAMDVLCPMEELKWVVENLQKCLTTMVQWTIHGRTFNFDVDASIAFRWGVKPNKEEKKEIQKWLA